MEVLLASNKTRAKDKVEMEDSNRLNNSHSKTIKEKDVATNKRTEVIEVVTTPITPTRP